MRHQLHAHSREEEANNVQEGEGAPELRKRRMQCSWKDAFIEGRGAGRGGIKDEKEEQE